MEGVPQDPVFHAEGDVAVHTRMVLEALQGLEGFQALDEQNQAVLIAAALLHDVEKRSTTQMEPDGRITSRGHAKKGALTSQRLLFAKHQAPFAIRQQVVGLVRHHGLPLWALEKRDPIPTLLRASLEVDMRLLALLAEADVKGRICEDQEDLLLRVGLFKAFCEEQSCWESMAEFPSQMAKYAFLNGKSSYRDYVPFEKDPFEVILLSGLPGMGKDHFIQTHYQDWPVISLDQLRRDRKVAPSNKKATGQIVQEAKEMADAGDEQKIHVVGTLKKDAEGSVVGIENSEDLLSFSFTMLDANAREQEVFYAEPMPIDFLRSEQVVVVGSYRNETFVADKILLKCPSKYQEDEIKTSSLN